MLVRRATGQLPELIHQEQHALVSGLLATAWRPALDPRLVAAILLHDNPWRHTDAEPRRGAGGEAIDFVAFPAEERLRFYADGLDELEAVDPYIATLVSLHYSSFAGIDAQTAFVRGEEARRRRLEPLVGGRIDTLDADLRWLQFFDVASLWLCLTGPDVDEVHLPAWLRAPRAFASPPDGVGRDWSWTDVDRATVAPWPFEDAEWAIDVVQTRERERRVRRVTLHPPRL